jgi:hypothetical protein
MHMSPVVKLIFVRLLPVLLIVAAAAFYAASVERGNAYLLRNLMPMLVIVFLSIGTLVLGKGHWTGAGWRLPLGIIGFALPALGLSVYLHYGYSVDLDGMVSGSVFPQEVFRYLPVYTSVAGAIGFAIGWIVGKNV